MMSWLLSSILLIIGLSSIIILTIIGNVLVCLSVILVRKLRKPQNYLLVSLAVSDLFVGLFVMPFAIIFEINEATWPLTSSLCDVWVSGDILLCTASILNLCAISVDRYRAITRPLEYSSVSSPRRMLSVIFIVWLSSACVSLPPVLLLGNVYTTPTGKPTCTISQNYWYQIYATLVSFYLPLCVMVVVYLKILRVVSAKKKQMTWTNSSRNSSLDRSTTTVQVDVQHQISNQYRLQRFGHHQPHCSQIGGAHHHHHQKTKVLSEQHLHSSTLISPCVFPLAIKKGNQLRQPVRLKDHKASTTLGIIMSAFIICWFPFFLLAIVRPIFLQEYDIPDWLTSLFLWLGYTNSALNPVIYATLNRDFRRPFREILCCRCLTLDDLMRREFYDKQYGKDNQSARCIKKFRNEQYGDGDTTNDPQQLDANDDTLVDNETNVVLNWSAI